MAFIWVIILLFWGNWLFTNGLVTFPLNIFEGFQNLATLLSALFILAISAWIFGEGKD